MTDLEMLRDHYKNVLQEKLEEKVIKQREEREKKKAMIKESATQESKQRFSKIRLPRSEGIEDTEFLQNIPVSKFYQIVKIQDCLEKSNELNKKHKVEEFYRLISKPEILAKLQKEFKNGNQLTFKKLQDLNATNNEQQQLGIRKQGPKALSPILDQEEAESKGGSSLSRKERNSSGDQKNISLDDMFPTVSYPKLPMINQNLESPEPDPVKVEESLELERRRSDVRQRKSQLARMYKASLAYEAATDRLMKKHQHLSISSIADDSDVKNLMVFDKERHHPLKNIKTQQPLKINAANTSIEKVDSSRNINEYLSSLADLPTRNRNSELQTFDERDEVERDSHCAPKDRIWKARAFSDATLRDEILGRIKHKSAPPERSPLTMQALEETSAIKIVKSPSKFWINPV